MAEVRSEIRPLLTELAGQKTGLPPNAIADLEATISSSPYLSNAMAMAIEQKQLKHLVVSNTPHESGHYDRATGTLHIATDNFDPNVRSRDRLDALAVVTGHETGHALMAEAQRQAEYRFDHDIKIPLREGLGNESYVDLTPPTERFMIVARQNEGLAELVGMNALASRVHAADPQNFTVQELANRANASTRCTEPSDAHGNHKLAPGIQLLPEGIQLTGGHIASPAVEAVAQCYYDKAKSLGQSGTVGYDAYYVANRVGSIAAELNSLDRSSTQQVPDVRLNLERLKVTGTQLESAGLDLGGASNKFSFTDTSRGQLTQTTLRHTDKSNSHSPKDQAEEIGLAQVHPALRADRPGHADHADFERIRGTVEADGRWKGEHSRNIAASLLAATKPDPVLQQLDGVVMGRPNAQGAVQVFGFSSPHGPQGPHHHVGVDAATAAQTSAERSLECIEQINQQQVQQQTQAQQVESQGARGQSGHRLGIGR